MMMIYPFNPLRPPKNFLRARPENFKTGEIKFGQFGQEVKRLIMKKKDFKKCPKSCPKLSELVRSGNLFRTGSDRKKGFVRS